MPDLKNPIFDEKASIIDKYGIMQSMADEFEAAYRYIKLASVTSDERTKAVYRDIAKEELVHAGEFMAILGITSPDVLALFEKGKEEVFEFLKKMENEQ